MLNTIRLISALPVFFEQGFDAHRAMHGGTVPSRNRDMQTVARSECQRDAHALGSLSVTVGLSHLARDVRSEGVARSIASTLAPASPAETARSK